MKYVTFLTAKLADKWVSARLELQNFKNRNTDEKNVECMNSKNT